MEKYLSKSIKHNKIDRQSKPYSIVRIKNLSPHESIAKKLDEINERLLYRTGVSIYNVINQCKQLEMFSSSSLENTYDCVQCLERLDDSENIILSLVDLFDSRYVSVMILDQLNLLVPVTQYDDFELVKIDDSGDWVTYPLSILSDSLN